MLHYRSAPASPSHVGMSGLMTPESLSREGSPTESASDSPAGLNSQSAPGSPRHRHEGELNYLSPHSFRLSDGVILWRTLKT